MTGCWDVVVVGGGPAGSLCAAALAGGGWRVLLAEAGDFSAPRPAEALSPTAVRRLQQAGVTGPAGGGATGVCRGVLAHWGTGDAALTDYELEPGGPGWIVRRPELDLQLFRRAAEAGATARMLWRCTAVDAESPGRPVEVELVTREGVRREPARFVVQATGRHALRGGARPAYSDHQVAYFATVGQVADTQDLLWVESAEAGWWYLLGLPPAGSQVVFVTESGPLTRRTGPEGPEGQGRRAFFRDQFERTRLRRAFTEPPAFHEVHACDARASQPRDPAPVRVLRIGDAAGTSDPLSGQGFRHAAESARLAAESLSRSLAGLAPLDTAALAGAAAARFDRHLATRASLWSLAGLGTPGNPPSSGA